MPSSAIREDNPGQREHDRPVLLHSLIFLDEGQEVTVGRADVDGYAVLPAEGANLLRRLEEGLTPAEAREWYEQTYGERVDIDDFLDSLDELRFLRDPGEAAHPGPPVRWRRLGRVVFSPAGGGCLASALIACAIIMLRSPELVPGYHDLFFTHYMTVLELAVIVGQLPLVLLHEMAHMLAGRRLGLRTRLSVARRLDYIVFVTAMDGLVTVPRRKRYVPMLAGMMADLLVFAVLIGAADVTRRTDGALSPASDVALAFAYLTLLRLAWQFFFYLQTDLYYVLVTVLGCVDLQGTARAVLRDRLGRALRRPVSPDHHGNPHPRDLAVARWYSWLLPVGWTASIAILIAGVIPAAAHVFATVGGRFLGSRAHSGADLARRSPTAPSRGMVTLTTMEDDDPEEAQFTRMRWNAPLSVEHAEPLMDGLGRLGFEVGHPGRAGAAKCPKYQPFMVKIEKIHGVSVAIATVSPWISNK